MNGTTSARSDRQLHRNKGLARISALTLGTGAASLVGAVAIAVTLPGSAVVSALKSTTASTLTSGSTTSGSTATGSTATGNDDSSSSGDDGSTSTSTTQAQALARAQAQAQAQAQSQLQAGTAPSTTNSPPAATSGAS